MTARDQIRAMLDQLMGTDNANVMSMLGLISSASISYYKLNIVSIYMINREVAPLCE
jgi:hypothetical protein